MANYVKFMRGTPDAWKNLPIDQRKADTLYFISEQDETVGQLYIGNKLITQHTKSEEVIDKLSELKDVKVDALTILNKQVLGWDSVQQAWVPMTIDVATKVSVMIGASEIEAGQEGLVPAPAAGDWNKFLRGDGTWVAIPELSGLRIKKVDSIDSIDPSASDADSYIYLVVNEDNGYSEYLVIDKKIELIGTLDVQLDGYVTDEELTTINTKVSNLEEALGNVNIQINNITGQLNSFITIEAYNEKMEQIDQDIADLKKATTWDNL